MRRDDRTPILYLAPWVDYGGTDKGTIDWFRWLDRDRFAPSLATTQPSLNRRLAEVAPYAEELWPLSDLLAAPEMPKFIFDFIHSREVEVLHIMNSRLGYELLPDLACLPKPPKVVVQLHVEEADRSGYVRYVTTRYGNLVDAFSVTSEHLAEAVHDYGIPRHRIHVIYTGVDAEGEFSPERVRPVDGLAEDEVHILWPGRLVEQKDPLLLVEVVARLRDRGARFQVHALGEGDLEPEVRRLMSERGIGEELVIHPPTPDLPRWYAACDLLLMTSVYEGVPYVVFEAMAMGLPVVAPALPGNVELLGELGEGLVDPRDDVDSYVGRLAELIENGGHRRELGARLRERVRERFSLARMGAEHSELYERMLGGGAGGNGAVKATETPVAPLRFRERALYDRPLVSAIVPCFNHGRFLHECVDAIRGQTHPDVEILVVDDASTDPETVAAIDELDRSDDVTTIRLAENGGPSRARNAALELARGRYVLPVDADNVLLPDAIERLLEQLRGAGEQVGFIYPNLAYFGNREDYFEAPDWDLFALMQRNVCDVCSLFDRQVFDAERFDESIRLGHEDWEFVLRLASRGVRGEPARDRTVRYRKTGFNRSDSVEYAVDPFHDSMRRRVPLYRTENSIKAQWAPAVSLIALEAIDAHGEAGRRLAARLAAQSCRDVELISRFDGSWPIRDADPPVRRVPTALASTPGRALVDALSVARGRVRVITAGTGSAVLGDPGFVEKVLRVLEPGGHPSGIEALALTDRGPERPFTMQLLGPQHALGPHTVVLTAGGEEHLRDPLEVDAGDPVAALVKQCVRSGLRVQWRHIAFERRLAATPASAGRVRLPRWRERERLGGEMAREWLDWPARVPSMPGTVPRWQHASTWTPPQSAILTRHREQHGEGRLVTTSRQPPRGYELEYDLGCVRVFSLEGTERLLALADGGYVTEPRGNWEAAPPGARHLGYVESVGFVGLEPLWLAEHQRTGQQVLVSGERDPLMHEARPLQALGFVEGFPANPPYPPHVDSPFGLVGLTRAVDKRARRHRAALGELPPGELIGELGGLIADGSPPAIPVWLIDGVLVTDRHRPPAQRVGMAAVGRWSLAPFAWRGFSSRGPKARAVARRAFRSAAVVGRTRPRSVPKPDGPPAAWLLSEGVPGTSPLYAAYHPVTGDQLLSTNRFEPIAMSYGEPELLGHMWPAAPVTGSLEQQPVPVPWASRFGLEAPRR
ncbi:MAG TPA: glycosyltransferase [Thermoleophilaceae bacterium]|nr:glycosyltransferase [Thermoleophilaceae bacterium]